MELPDLGALTDLDERLRQVPRDEAAVERVLARALGYAGEAARVLGLHEQALRYLRDSVALARDERAHAVASTRLGEALRCADELGEAEAVLRRALELCAGGPHEHYARQHLGKCLLDAGRADEAVEQLEAALVTREQIGDGALVASTTAALERACRLRDTRAERPEEGEEG